MTNHITTIATGQIVRDKLSPTVTEMTTERCNSWSKYKIITISHLHMIVESEILFEDECEQNDKCKSTNSESHSDFILILGNITHLLI